MLYEGVPVAAGAAMAAADVISLFLVFPLHSFPLYALLILFPHSVTTLRSASNFLHVHVGTDALGKKGRMRSKNKLERAYIGCTYNKTLD